MTSGVTLNRRPEEWIAARNRAYSNYCQSRAFAITLYVVGALFMCAAALAVAGFFVPDKLMLNAGLINPGGIKLGFAAAGTAALVLAALSFQGAGGVFYGSCLASYMKKEKLVQLNKLRDVNSWDALQDWYDAWEGKEDDFNPLVELQGYGAVDHDKVSAVLGILKIRSSLMVSLEGFNRQTDNMGIEDLRVKEAKERVQQFLRIPSPSLQLDGCSISEISKEGSKFFTLDHRMRQYDNLTSLYLPSQEELDWLQKIADFTPFEHYLLSSVAPIPEEWKAEN